MPNARAACAAVCSPARTSRIAAARRWADVGVSRPRSEYGGGLLLLPWLWLRIGPPAFVGDFLGGVYFPISWAIQPAVSSPPGAEAAGVSSTLN